jgi:hypothetical protein
METRKDVIQRTAADHKVYRFRQMIRNGLASALIAVDIDCTHFLDTEGAIIDEMNPLLFCVSP